MKVLNMRGVYQSALMQDLLTLWVAISLAVAYLNVPLLNTSLFATALVLQAALGTVVLTKLLSGVRSSLLMLGGPGLIVGGAISFTVFQVTGRGILGSAVTLSAGLVGVLLLKLSPSNLGDSPFSRTRVLGNILGLAALALSSEFSWLLLVAIIFFVLLLVPPSGRSQRKYRLIVASSTLIPVLVIAVTIRGENWSLITDDYLFFEVLARHLTNSGPLAMWGTSDFSRYHWLSYGWSGLLNTLALTPDALITLTRVMPLVYAIALGASTLLCLRIGQRLDGLTAASTLPAWTLLCAFRLDWSGTSTAAAIVVLAAFCSLLIVVVESRQTRLRRLGLYILFGSIALFTKAPSVLTLPLLVVATEAGLLAKRSKRAHRTLAVTMMVMSACIAILALLPTFSSVVGSFSVEWGKQRGDELSRSGLPLTLITLIGRNSWIVVLVLVAWLYNRTVHEASLPGRVRLILLISPAFAVAVALDAVVVGVANTNEYFSGPFYFISLLSILTLQPVTASHVLRNGVSQTRSWVSLAVMAVAITMVAERAAIQSLIGSSIARDLLTDSRVLFGGLMIVAFTASPARLTRSTSVALALILSLVAYAGLSPVIRSLANEGWRPIVPDIEMNVLIGPPDARTSALWLRDNSAPHDLVATNYLRDKAGEFDNDYSLAAWSRREFLVLGPSLSFDSTLTDEALKISEEFAVKPSAELAADLRAQGVKWYIVDLDKTPLRSWEPYAETVVMTWRFWVLQL